MINLKIDPEFQNQIPPLTDDEYKQLEENILKEGKLLSPLIVWNNTLVDGHNRYAILQKHPEIYFSTMPLGLRTAKKPLRGFARINWGGATSRRSRRSSLLESSTASSIGSPVETATISIQQPRRKRFRRNCVKMTQFLLSVLKQASARRLQSSTMSVNPMFPAPKSL